MGLAELFVSDDLDIPYDPSTYQDQTDPPPPLPGNYRMQVIGKLKPAKEFGSDKPKLIDGQYPVLQFDRVKILEPLEAEKEFAVFQEVATKPFDRYGTASSGLTDFLRALDQTVAAPSRNERIQAVEEMIDNGQSFVGQIAWEVYDSAYVREQFEAAGIAKGEEKRAIADGKISAEKAKAIYKSGRYGNKDFKVVAKADGTLTLSPSIPSKATEGGMLTVKNPKIKKFVPSLEADRTPLGSFRLKN